MTLHSSLARQYIQIKVVDCIVSYCLLDSLQIKHACGLCLSLMVGLKNCACAWWCQMDLSARASVALTLLLAIGVFQLILNEIMPQTGPSLDQKRPDSNNLAPFSRPTVGTEVAKT